MTKEQLLRETDVFLLDLDGTVYVDGVPVGGMRQTLSRLRALGKRLVFLTNNSSKTEDDYRAKLLSIGLYAEGDAVYTSGMATAEYLRAHCAGKRVFLLGTEKLKAKFCAAGIVLDDVSPDILVLAYDVELTFEKIRRFDRFLRAGLPFLATHADAVCPTADGSMPDVGSFLDLFERSSGRKPDVVIGKPNVYMGDALRKFAPHAHMCMVGDRLYTDIRFARNCNMRSILVLSGETKREDVARASDQPDLILSDLNEIF